MIWGSLKIGDCPGFNSLSGGEGDAINLRDFIIDHHEEHEEHEDFFFFLHVLHALHGKKML